MVHRCIDYTGCVNGGECAALLEVTLRGRAIQLKSCRSMLERVGIRDAPVGALQPPGRTWNRIDDQVAGQSPSFG